MSLAEQLRRALARDADPTRLLAGDDHDLWIEAGEAATPAAVLVAVVDRAEPGVILTVRPETMRRHPGQIAFPGGRIDEHDADAVAAALREAEEEIGLQPEVVEVVGQVQSYRTVTGFEVVPVLGVIPPDQPLRPNPDEVAGMFEAPLHFLLDPANQLERRQEWRGRERAYFEILWQDRRIWGATAAMLVNLGRRLELAR